MYTSFYNLDRKPFQINSDPTFMWLGEKHKEALAILKYGILDNKGFLLLTGDVGTGKTTLINSLLQSLSHDIISTTVPDPGLEKLDFFNYIAAGFGIEKQFLTKGTFLAHFRKFLIQASEEKKKVLLIIDEAQLLTQEMLEEIRLLSNIEKTDAKLINIFFIGQNEFNEILNRNQNRAVRQRLTLNYNIDPLTPDETGEYIRHRLTIAGATYPIFHEEALQEVYLYSGGFPRRINVICDHCLLSGYVKEKKTIDGSIVRECANELRIPASVKNKDINGFTVSEPKVLPIAPANDLVLNKAPEIKNKKTPHTRFFLKFIICLFIAFFVVFFSFPDQFKEQIFFINKNIQKIRHQLFQPDLDSSALLVEEGEKQIVKDKKADDNPPISLNKEQGGKIEIPIARNEVQIEGRKLKDQGSVEKTKKETLPSEKLHPIAEEVTQADTTQTDNIIKVESGIKVEDKKVLPLPTEKLVVRFKYDNNDFTEEGLDKLTDFTDILVMHPDAKILITGYTDAEGYEKYNIKLSEFRANIIRSYFLGKGIRPDQIEVLGSGSKNPIETNDTAWGRMMNRRVEIQVKKK